MSANKNEVIFFMLSLQTSMKLIVAHLMNMPLAKGVFASFYKCRE